MSEIRYTEDHEWIRIEGDIGVIGITEYAQEQLGDVVYIELPEIGRTVAKGAEAAIVESVKAASEIYAPMSGTVVEVNAVLAETPALVNEDATGKGWFLKLQLDSPGELDGLMDEAAYRRFLEGLH